MRANLPDQDYVLAGGTLLGQHRDGAHRLPKIGVCP